MKLKLSPRIKSYCQQCTPGERRIALAYCSYLACADRQLRRMEIQFIRALAEEAGETEELLADYAKRARRGKLKIRMPKSQVARSLLFQVALAVVAVDGQIDPRERKAIDRLAKLLGLSSEIVDAELGELTNNVTAIPTSKTVVPSKPGDPRPEIGHEPERQGFFEQIVEFFTSHVVIEDYEAKLYPVDKAIPTHKVGEVEFSRRKNGQVEIEVELKRLEPPTATSLSVFLNEQHFRDVNPVGGRFDETFVFNAGEPSPAISPGMTAEIRHGTNVLLRGQFVID